MANSNGWGDGAANNAIGWGQGANNAIGWGKSHTTSWAGATDIVGLTTDCNTYLSSLEKYLYTCILSIAFVIKLFNSS